MAFTSIIIPTHNRAGMLREAVESALALPGSREREILVVNDGSTDATAEALTGYRDRVRAITISHGERSRARNAGLEAAAGEMVCFLDDDDLFLASGLEALEATLIEAPGDVAIVYGRPRYVWTDPNTPLGGTQPPQIGASGWILPHLLRNNFLVMGNLVARREALTALGGFDPDWPPVEDYELWIRTAARWRVLFREVEVAEIRLHGGNRSANMARSFQRCEQARQAYLLSSRCLNEVEAREEQGKPADRDELAEICLDLARQRWWQGSLPTSRSAFKQAVRLAPRRAFWGMGELWRLWLPLYRSIQSESARSDAPQRGPRGTGRR